MTESDTLAREATSKRLLYDVDKKDLVALGKWHFKNSPASTRPRRLVLLILITVVFVAVFLSSGDDDQRFSSAIAEGLVGSLFVIVFYMVTVWPLTLLQLNLRFGRKNSQGLIGWRELTLDESNLKERTEVYESARRLESIDNVVSTKSHTFIYVNSFMAHVVPHASIREGDREGFVASLNQAIAKRKADLR